MSQMRDELVRLKGKRVSVMVCGGIRIKKSPIYGPNVAWHEIIEVGNDYFVIKFVSRSPFIPGDKPPITHAISDIVKIYDRYD